MTKCKTCRKEITRLCDKKNARCKECHTIYVREWRNSKKQDRFKLEDYQELTEE